MSNLSSWHQKMFWFCSVLMLYVCPCLAVTLLPVTFTSGPRPVAEPLLKALPISKQSKAIQRKKEEKRCSTSRRSKVVFGNDTRPLCSCSIDQTQSLGEAWHRNIRKWYASPGGILMCILLSSKQVKNVPSVDYTFSFLFHLILV